MKKDKIVFLAGLMLVASCTSHKQVPYLQNSAMLDSSKTVELYEARIQPKDMLTIIVSDEVAESTAIFNLEQPYLVDNNGCIDFPVLGRLYVGGLTTNEVKDLIRNKLASNFQKTKTPIVNVRLADYKISVLGEVANPGIYVAADESVNVFEALAMAGDLTIYGRRDAVKLIREDINGTKQIILINLNDANLIYSPYYQLQQNDILYVEPNKVKAKSADVSAQTSLIVSATSALMSIINILLNIFR